MLQIQNSAPVHPFSIESLMEFYKNLTFPQRAKLFEIFLPENVKLKKKNPPYSSSMFPEMTKHIISIVSYFLGYRTNQWADETIIGFLSMFVTIEKPLVTFHYSEFLAEVIHE